MRQVHQRNKGRKMQELKDFLFVWWHGSTAISWAKFSDYRTDRLQRCGFNYYVLQIGHIHVMVSYA
jgi:hypothetical protein